MTLFFEEGYVRNGMIENIGSSNNINGVFETTWIPQMGRES
jgi:hypothetical protein